MLEMGRLRDDFGTTGTWNILLIHLLGEVGAGARRGVADSEGSQNVGKFHLID